MKTITMRAVIDLDKCVGCGVCAKVCPVLAISVKAKKAQVDESKCRACANCNQRCPTAAVAMEKLEKPFIVSVKAQEKDMPRIEELCLKAGFNPGQILCYCTATRASEVAACILGGAETPEQISFLTGLRTGCSVECIQPALRMLEAAGIKPVPPKDGWQWYGRTITLKEVPEAIKEKYNGRGFCFAEDQALFDELVGTDRR